MSDKNIYDYIIENVPKWSVFCSYGYPALEIVSQTPNYIISGVPTHIPPVSGKKKRYIDMFHILKMEIPLGEYFKLLNNYDCSYLMLKTNEEYHYSKKDHVTSPDIGVSFIVTRKKMEYFPEIFSNIYEDNTYSLFHINSNINLFELEKSLLKSLDNISDNYSDGYSIATKLLLLNHNEEYFKMQEFYRSKIIKNNKDLAKLTVAFHGIDYQSNVQFASFPNDFYTFFDQEFYPSIKEEIYLASSDKADKEENLQYLIINLNTARAIHEIRIEWYDYESRVKDFQIYSTADGNNSKLIDTIINNQETTYNKSFDVPIKAEALKIVVKKGYEKLLMKSISIY
jgi:hypothetical protein